MTLVLDGTLDAHSRDDLTRMAPGQAAQEQYDNELDRYASPHDWWRIATLPDGEPVGFVIPAHNGYNPIIAYLAVVPAHRGHGYIHDVLAAGTSLLAAQTVPRIRAATDVGNAPMAAAYLTAAATWSCPLRRRAAPWPSSATASRTPREGQQKAAGRLAPYARRVDRRPLQNRVLPTGEIVADPARGTLMGNRGCLHGTGRELGVARWRSRLWICCTLIWKDVHRDPMPPGRWTALFFLDEATALAAGHRPCAYCRRADFLAYAEAWRSAQSLARRPWAYEMDARLHDERVESRTRRQITRPARCGDLPAGTMVRHDGIVGLVWQRRFLPWANTGYGSALPLPDRVELLTPPASVAALRAGYRPALHPSAEYQAAAAGRGVSWQSSARWVAITDRTCPRRRLHASPLTPACSRRS
jgi:hypothetical protein